ncbi:MAG: hypothetical protein HY939_03000 [Gammaproteobacteria bacterium]|nr:hypothetical protein [Gammaproteobacteria bacterium]
MHPFRDLLKGGDLRSIGKANEVVEIVIHAPERIQELTLCLKSKDPIVRMRASDAIEKISHSHPKLIQIIKDALIRESTHTEQQEVKWHLAQVFERLELSTCDRKIIVPILFRWLEQDSSRIVQVSSLQCLVSFADRDRQLRRKVLQKIEAAASFGSPAIQVRCRKLAKKFLWIRE